MSIYIRVYAVLPNLFGILGMEVLRCLEVAELSSMLNSGDASALFVDTAVVIRQVIHPFQSFPHSNPSRHAICLPQMCWTWPGRRTMPGWLPAVLITRSSYGTPQNFQVFLSFSYIKRMFNVFYRIFVIHSQRW